MKDKQELLAEAKDALRQNNPVVGVALLTQALFYDDGLAEAHLLRGQALRAMGDAKGAEADSQWLMEHADSLSPQLFDDVSGDFMAKGVEHLHKRPFSALNPFGVGKK
jgi:hypothetical protein